MKKDTLHEPFELVLKDFMNVCSKGEHSHSFFELVYIREGTGQQRINATHFQYQSGHLFLLAPEDAHCFDIETPTQFFFIRFNTIYLQAEAKQQDLLQRMELILRNASHQPGCVLKNSSDKAVIRPLMEALIREHQQKDLYHKELIAQYVNTLLVIVARNLMTTLPEKIDEQSENKVITILQYVQSNIYHPERLKGEYISKEFGISESYLGRYFRKHTNETLQQYILNYKLKLIENRLLHTNMRITEIAYEFGFTDKSHLNRFFKKSRGINPSDYRKNSRI
ncbi:AraC family transcriptional regulator [Xanthocytophaga agilis]|uniref:AraC family transcriptional regulator n=1 Tax=Xanthocytophaga agilis TaxID=3048010 RepID=A0AAE3R1K5_9BACT|nr:AraC family transcriptional regulator [Xanthocytophaga agilis]MDJ1499954.1 AraC family transcriptional regulator [Xanthocytophaga agilis]